MPLFGMAPEDGSQTATQGGVAGRIGVAGATMKHLSIEPHYTLDVLAKRIGTKPAGILPWIRNESGVLRVKKVLKNGAVRTEIRIPESVWNRVYRNQIDRTRSSD